MMNSYTEEIKGLLIAARAKRGMSVEDVPEGTFGIEEELDKLGEYFMCEICRSKLYTNDPCSCEMDDEDYE